MKQCQPHPCVFRARTIQSSGRALNAQRDCRTKLRSALTKRLATANPITAAAPGHNKKPTAQCGKRPCPLEPTTPLRMEVAQQRSRRGHGRSGRRRCRLRNRCQKRIYAPTARPTGIRRKRCTPRRRADRRDRVARCLRSHSHRPSSHTTASVPSAGRSPQRSPAIGPTPCLPPRRASSTTPDRALPVR